MIIIIVSVMINTLTIEQPPPQAASPPTSAGSAPQRPLNSPMASALTIFALVLALLVSIFVAISTGAAWLPVGDTLRYLGAALSGGSIPASELTDYTVIWDVRTPRVLLAAIVGAGLSSIGVATQAMVRNPLADPFILGISSGASVGASAVVAFGVFASLGVYALSLAAFLGAILASAIVYLMARSHGGLVPLRLILTGVVMAYGFQAIMSLIVFIEPRGDAARTVMFWMLGSFGGAHWGALPIALGAVVVICCYLGVNGGRLDVMALGDATAASMGVDCVSLRRQLFLLTAIATGALVAVSGAVGFVGLVIPHIVRLAVGPMHRRVLILSPLVGAIFLVWVDMVSRVVMAPRELPLGVVTAIVGVPVFIILMRRRGYVFGGAAA